MHNDHKEWKGRFITWVEIEKYKNGTKTTQKDAKRTHWDAQWHDHIKTQNYHKEKIKELQMHKTGPHTKISKTDTQKRIKKNNKIEQTETEWQYR